jgi:glucose/arabinose dehydrogenase
MKKIIAVLFAATISCCLTAVAMAETKEQAISEKTIAKTVKQQSSKEKMLPAPEVQLKRLAKGLQLTVEQQKLIRPMLLEEYAKLKELRQDDNLSPKQIQAKVETLRNETATKMQTVMTPEQREKHDLVRSEIMANKQKRIQENRKARIGTQPDTPAQKSK